MPSAEPVVVASAPPTESKTSRVFRVEAPTPAELTRELAAVTATLEALRRAPRLDFQVRPNEQAWSRLTREADALMAEILAARRR